MEQEKKTLIAIVGPTASGKTSLSIRLAKKYNGEIVSADSMQIYKGMTIATAKPTEQEMCGVPHHLIDFLPTDKTFSVSQYAELANCAIEDIFSRGKQPILCGGTGLYVRSLIENIQFPPDKPNGNIRAVLRERYESEGGQALIDELSKFDPETAAKLHPSNGKRIIRAIEIYLTTGKTMSEHIKESKNVPSPYKIIAIGINYADRQKLYDRINLRVDIMLEQGLLEEAARFYSGENSETSTAAIGYKELKPYLDGKTDLETAVERLKLETRHYAKRQLTWFKRDDYIHWIYADICGDVYEEAVKIIEENR